MPGDRARVRQYATIAALDYLRRTLGAGRASDPPVSAFVVVAVTEVDAVDVAGAAVVVTGTPSGASSSQVLPGCRVIGAPSVAVSVAGAVSELPAPRAGDGHAVAQHHRRTRPGGRHLHLVAALVVLEPGAGEGRDGQHDHVGRRRLGPVDQLVGDPRVGPQVGSAVAGFHVQVTSDVDEKGTCTDAPDPGTAPAGSAASR